jgi:hypothetical protein
MPPLDILTAMSLNSPATYLQWGWVGISIPNLIVMLVTVLAFVLALVLPFPKGDDD